MKVNCSLATCGYSEQELNKCSIICNQCHQRNLNERLGYKIKFENAQEKIKLMENQYNQIIKLNEKIDELILYVTNKKQAKTEKRNERISKKDRLFLLDTNENKCSNCKNKFERKYLHIDHIIPLGNGGKNIISNLQILCVECNLAKKDYIRIGDDKNDK